jgi:hypothetical protein
MTNGMTNPLLTNTQSTIAAGFLSVLSTVGLPASVTCVPDAGAGNQNDSGAQSSQPDPSAATPQSDANAQNANLGPAAPLPPLAVTNPAGLHLAAVHAVRSGISDATPLTTQQKRTDDAKSVSTVKTVTPENALSVPVQPLAVDVVAIANPRTGKSVITSFSPVNTGAPVVQPEVPALTNTREASAGVTASGQGLVTSNTAASEMPAQLSVPVTASSTDMRPGQFTGNSRPSLSTSQESVSVSSIPQLTIAPAMHTVGAAETPVRNSTAEMSLYPVANPETSRAAKTEAPSQAIPLILQADPNSTAPISTTAVAGRSWTEDPYLTTTILAHSASAPRENSPQQNSDSSDTAANNNVSAAPAIPVNTPRSTQQHDLPFVLAQGLTQTLNPATLASVLTAGSQGHSPATAANDTAVTNQSKVSSSAQNATLASFRAPSTPVLSDSSFTSSTSLAAGAIGKPAGTRADFSGTGKDLGTSSGSGSTKSNSAPATATSADPANSETHSNAAQHAQADASQVNAAAMKTADSAAPQTATLHLAAQQQPQSGTPGGATDRLPTEIAGSTLPSTAEPTESGAASGINSAKLIQTLSETQMHVGMRSAEFGDISIRTAVSQQQMVAQITVDHSDLGKAIAQHLPAAQTKLGDDLGVRAAIQVTQSGMSFSHHHDGASHQEQRSLVRQIESTGAASSAETESPTPRYAIAAEESDRLDIRA